MTNSLANTSASQDRLSPHQRQLLSRMIDHAKQRSRGCIGIARNGVSYWVKPRQGRIAWSVARDYGILIAQGEH